MNWADLPKETLEMLWNEKFYLIQIRDLNPDWSLSPEGIVELQKQQDQKKSGKPRILRQAHKD